MHDFVPWALHWRIYQMRAPSVETMSCVIATSYLATVMLLISPSDRIFQRQEDNHLLSISLSFFLDVSTACRWHVTGHTAFRSAALPTGALTEMRLDTPHALCTDRHRRQIRHLAKHWGYHGTRSEKIKFREVYMSSLPGGRTFPYALNL